MCADSERERHDGHARDFSFPFAHDASVHRCRRRRRRCGCVPITPTDCNCCLPSVACRALESGKQTTTARRCPEVPTSRRSNDRVIAAWVVYETTTPINKRCSWSAVAKASDRQWGAKRRQTGGTQPAAARVTARRYVTFVPFRYVRGDQYYAPPANRNRFACLSNAAAAAASANPVWLYGKLQQSPLLSPLTAVQGAEGC